jgi:hypothetical protein
VAPSKSGDKMRRDSLCAHTPQSAGTFGNKPAAFSSLFNLRELSSIGSTNFEIVASSK